jgi:hypothetical protein
VFALLILAGLIYSAAHAWFWQRAHDMVWLAAPLGLLLLGLLLRRRSRVAWWVFLWIFGLGFASDLAHVAEGHVSARWLIGAVVGLVELGLLVSPPMREFVRPRGRVPSTPS